VTYPVSAIFHSLQGEGQFVGYPMTFVRLAGCSVLDCHIRRECDEAPWKATFTATANEIVERVRQLKSAGIVCITGGEPSDHDLIPLVDVLSTAGYRIHLETSGARPILGLPIEWLTVSPKVLSAGGLKQRVGHTLKIVVRPEWSESQAWGIVRSLDAGH
jgi:7-carboxy-7-deazaguanine synthase